MADQITTAFIRQFIAGLKMVVQQLESKFRGRVQIEPITGTLAYVDYVGQADTPQAQQALIQKTNLQEITHARRIIMGKPYPMAVPVSKQALSRLLQDPTGTYVQTLRASFNRLIDKILMSQAIATALTSSTDDLTQASVTWPSGSQQLAESGTVGMTAGKVIKALTQFNLNDVPEEAEKHLALSPLGIEDLLLDPDVTYSQQIALEQIRTGEVKTLWGFQTAMSNQLPKSGNIRSCVAWVKEGLCLGINSDIEVDIAQRKDLNNLWQILMSMDLGATRMEEKLVYEIQMYEAS